jgi:hypothetical protein
MSVDAFNDVLDTARAELNDELSFSSVDNSVGGNMFSFVT